VIEEASEVLVVIKAEDANVQKRITRNGIPLYVTKVAWSGMAKSNHSSYLSIPINEYEITEEFLGPNLKDEVLKIMLVQT